MKFVIYTLGCKVNQYDSMALKKRLFELGHTEAATEAQFAIINSCAVTATAMQKSRRMLKKARIKNPHAKIVLAGCWPKTHDVAASGADLAIDEHGIDAMATRIENESRILGLGTGNMPNEPRIEKARAYPDGRSRYFLKIQDGCDQFCSYCIIPYARGAPASRPVQDVICEAEEAVGAGYREIVLCGIHLGKYGVRTENSRTGPANQGADLTVLLKELLSHTAGARFRLSSIEITEIGNDLLELIATEERICRHLHIPLQSGSARVLALMNRPYSPGVFMERIRRIKKIVSDIAITTDVIAGFPGETGPDHRDTMLMIESCGFSRLHVFPFSAHERVPAASFAGKTPRDTIFHRAGELRELGRELDTRYAASRRGKIAEVLIESEAPGGRFRGKTSQFEDAVFTKDKMINPGSNVSCIGSLVHIEL